MNDTQHLENEENETQHVERRMSQLTTSAALGRITRIDGDFIMLENGYAFWLEPTLAGTQGIQLGDMVALTYDISTMKVVKICKVGNE